MEVVKICRAGWNIRRRRRQRRRPSRRKRSEWRNIQGDTKEIFIFYL